MDNIIEALKIKVKEFLSHDWSWHDYRHAERVLRNAEHIQSVEWWNELVVSSAALVHDICRPREKINKKSHFGDEALEIIAWVWQSLNAYKWEEIDSIIEIVKYHDVYDWNASSVKSLELQIVQDADNLDAIGALWIARTFAFGGAHWLIMYEPWESLQYKDPFVEAVGKYTTTIWHFYEKLLKLSTNMNTSTWRKMAEWRHGFMEIFLEQFFAERDWKR